MFWKVAISCEVLQLEWWGAANRDKLPEEQLYEIPPSVLVSGLCEPMAKVLRSPNTNVASLHSISPKKLFRNFDRHCKVLSTTVDLDHGVAALKNTSGRRRCLPSGTTCKRP